jgi:zinc transporter ZupT
MSEELSDEIYWKNAIKKHMTALIVAIIAGVCLFIGAVLVMFWFINTSPIGLQGAATFDQWSLDWIVGFLILIILWELLFVGIPAGLFFGVGGYIFWKNLPEEEKQEHKAREKKNKHRKRNASSGGGFSFFVFIAYCITMGIRGDYYVAFGSHKYSYWVLYWFLTIMWIFIIFGVPICIILIIVYFKVWRKKSE